MQFLAFQDQAIRKKQTTAATKNILIIDPISSQDIYWCLFLSFCVQRIWLGNGQSGSPRDMARQKCGLHSVCGEGSPECCQFSGELSEVLFLTAIFWNNSGSWLLLWGLLLCSCVCTCSVVSDSCDSMDYTARKASLSMGFPRQEYWSGLSFFFFW